MSGEHTHPEVTALDTALAILTERVGRLTAQVVTAEAALAALDTRVTALEARPAWDLDYAYLGKPGPTQTIGRKYSRLDLSGWDPEADGWENTLRYLNISPTFRDGKVAGAIRPRLMRANGDPTDYDDILLHADALDSDGRTLSTHTYWEWGDGVDTWIELKCIGGLASAEVSTRYTKKALLHRA